MRYIVDGAALVLGSPKLWRYIFQPLAVAALALIAVSAIAYWLIVPPLNAVIVERVHAQGPLSGAIAALTTGLFMVLLLLCSGFLYLTFVSFFSGALWEKLSREVEVMQTGREIEAKLPTSDIVKDAISRGALALFVSSICLCCGWFFFGVPAILLAGYVGLHDYTSAAYLRRGITFPAQMSHVNKLRGRFGFLVGAGLLTLIPVVNVLVLPCLVAGGTLLVIDGERRIAS